ncbi:hypothetical protein LPB136_08385 [Tenacibaculum todarodis]|uniref:Carboxypeptidase-like regulatory domain-containing protein n=1 Tax=Tenacibaculum todarodis TaxID=1850252 RepID=A0A1L3JJQ7_9FLAO|nr:carboxypeptidase-like regulatory domain-containing protein [Tenacibaculum todarodis]APG65368.1 hypothetical protein LPB136_08385 [Tenacibaculum todarodis]
MKIKVFAILFFINYLTFSQKTLKGKVVFKNTPLEGASVYLNNTTAGTITNNSGEFSFKTKEGKFDLIISYLGYKKKVFSLNTSEYKNPLLFSLEEEDNLLNEVVIRKTKYDENWKYNLNRFKREFIGTTKISKNCTILNPKVLHFEFDGKNNILTAFAKEPLQIKNKSLGYLISYELVSFEINKNYVTYLGYSKYEEIKGGARKLKRWKNNRTLTYNGSVAHFLKSVLNDTFTEEGYIVNQFKRVKNPQRPSEQEVKKARELIRLSGSTYFDRKNIINPKNAIDSARVVLSKIRLPRFRDYLYKSKLTKDEIITYKNNFTQLSFKDNLSIVYNNEKEESGYQLRLPHNKRRKGLPQTSSMIALKANSLVDKNGLLFNPLDIYYEGYWSYEKFANTLPLDYRPED